MVDSNIDMFPLLLEGHQLKIPDPEDYRWHDKNILNSNITFYKYSIKLINGTIHENINSIQNNSLLW